MAEMTSLQMPWQALAEVTLSSILKHRLEDTIRDKIPILEKPAFGGKAQFLFCCSIGNAQIIYSNAFNGGAVSIYAACAHLLHQLRWRHEFRVVECPEQQRYILPAHRRHRWHNLEQLLLPFTPGLVMFIP